MEKQLEIGQWNMTDPMEGRKRHLKGWWQQGICGTHTGQSNSGVVGYSTVYVQDLRNGNIPRDLCARCVKIAVA